MTRNRDRIVLTTFGSLGDLHPYMAVALEWKRRGHDAVIATSELYRQRVESQGLEFAAVRPDLPDFADSHEMTRKVFDLRRGPEFMIREMLMPRQRESFDDLMRASGGADLVVSHPLTFAAPLVAQKRGIAWASSVLSPLSLLSAYDPPVMAPAPGLTRLRWLGPRFIQSALWLIKKTLRSWTEPIRELRRDEGLPPSPLDPMFEGQFSPALNLAMFPSLLAAPQPDWPATTVVTGTPFYDGGGAASPLDPALRAFLESGPEPVVFTLGSAAVMDAKDFYTASAEAAAQVGCRAILLVGPDPRNLPPRPLPGGVITAEYAPFSQLFPHAAAIVHQGGIGTTAQAMRAGRPMLVMPFGFDQPDNAERVERLGIAKVIPRTRYTAARAAAALAPLLRDPALRARAAAVGRKVANEDGAVAACDALEGVLRTSPHL